MQRFLRYLNLTYFPFSEFSVTKIKGTSPEFRQCNSDGLVIFDFQPAQAAASPYLGSLNSFFLI